MSAISLLISYYQTLVLSPPCSLLYLSFYLKLCGRYWLLFPPVLSGCNGSPDTRFSRRTTRLMSWTDGEHYLRSLQSLEVSLLLSLVSTFVFSQTGGVLSHWNSSTRSFPRFFFQSTCAPSSRSLCALLSTMQRTQPAVKLLSL